MATKQKLFADFSPTSKEEWKAKIITDLKGAPYDKKLVWRSKEGFDVEPFYRREDLDGLLTPQVAPGEYPYVRSTRLNNDWYTRQEIQASSPEEANQKALDLLFKGIDAPAFNLANSWISQEGLSSLLREIDCTAIELNLCCCVTQAAHLAEELTKYFENEGMDFTRVTGSINYNPFKRELVRGKKNLNWKAEMRQVVQAAQALKGMRILQVDAYMLANAGAYITQELGYALAWGAEMLHALAEEGTPIPEAVQRIKFNFGIGANYFMEIAKFRAARWLWAKIVSAYGEEYQSIAKINQHAITSQWNMTRYDAYVNLLRTQTEAMSAALGGVDSITVLPFDTPYGTSDDFSMRIARNQQLLLKEESHFDKVVDPSSGSYYIENLTHKIAHKAWEIFLSTEQEGGFAMNVQNGKVQGTINATNASRHQALAQRKESLLGTNEYPNFNETIHKKIPTSNSSHHHTCGVDHTKEENVTPLDFRRGASDFETLRLNTEQATKRPIVFMLTIGNLAMRLARSQFAGNFFACAGYQLIDNLGFDAIEEGVNAALALNADIIVLCSSDDEYATFAPEAYYNINGRCEMVIAGNPTCRPDLEALGIEHYIHVKSDVLSTLSHFNQKFGI
ncbi:MAG: methylmalonyl-CoA mutase small subunit [Bacteroidales bacterium]|nr:methylmalonyl-CoA mutase small subunit [Porphyromonas sp.]MDD6934094.1 methylmalonyl-CoA mutase small subunit [Bacteroidales bacterium]MDY3102934.1 methylmalonyl-CoA mutase small subunit [Porphyromonas sp.]